ncbi:MAG: GNAT family N-acetyltransferase [Gammaproteobacteria bacterium]
MNDDFRLMHCSWQDSCEALTAVRRIVFIEEQQVPQALELDELDRISHHVLVSAKDGQPIATGRIGPDGRIGRMAVLKAYRRRGIGSALLAALLDHARQNGLAGVYLHAQLSAIPFYEKHGFVAEGESFMDAGIAHKSMIYRPLSLP